MTTPKAQERKRPRATVNPVTASSRVSDALWAVLAAGGPEHQNTPRWGGGRPRVPARQCAGALFYVLRTGCQWGALAATELCPHSTAHDRVQEGGAAGVVLKLGKAGGEQVEELQGLDWSGLSLDGAMTKAPLGGKKPGPHPTDRAQGGAKRSLLTEGYGVPVGLVVAGAKRPDLKLVKDTVASVVVKRPRPTKNRPRGRCLDTG
jgi:putative transposase